MPGRLKDKIAIVTGAGQGIGAATARCFAAEGACVAVAEINAETGAAMAAELTAKGAQALFIQTDVTDPVSVARMAQETQEVFGMPDILVNNAGINVFRDPLSTTDEEWRRCMSVDLDGVWNCCRAVLPAMLEAGRGCDRQHRLVPFLQDHSGLLPLSRRQARPPRPDAGAWRSNTRRAAFA